MRPLLLLMMLFSPATLAGPNIAIDRQAALDAAREIISSDTFATLITVDEEGQPRSRTIEHSGPNDDFIIYLSTIPGTRKLDQIGAHSKVTLYFTGPGDTSYVSLMGEATIHTDRKTTINHDWRSPEARARFWPDFPDDYVLIEFKPRWLEVVAPGIRSRDSDWRPQAVHFD